MKKNTVLVIGDIILDKYTYGYIKRDNPESVSAKLLDVEYDEFKLGGAGNVAANIASLNGGCDLYGFVGKDRSAEKIHRICKSANISLTTSRSKQHTIIKQRFIEISKEEQLLRGDYENYLTADSYSELESVLKKNKYELIIISDYNKGVISEESINLIRELSSNTPLWIDSKKTDIGIFGEDILLKINEKELKNIAKINKLCNNTKIEESIKELGNNYRCNIITTLAEKGCITYCYKTQLLTHIPQKERKVLDVCGAGDVFMAILSYGFLGGKGIIESSKIANNLAGESVSHIGNYIIKINENDFN